MHDTAHQPLAQPEMHISYWQRVKHVPLCNSSGQHKHCITALLPDSDSLLYLRCSNVYVVPPACLQMIDYDFGAAARAAAVKGPSKTLRNGQYMRSASDEDSDFEES